MFGEIPNTIYVVVPVGPSWQSRAKSAFIYGAAGATVGFLGSFASLAASPPVIPPYIPYERSPFPRARDWCSQNGVSYRCMDKYEPALNAHKKAEDEKANDVYQAYQAEEARIKTAAYEGVLYSAGVMTVVGAATGAFYGWQHPKPNPVVEGVAALLDALNKLAVELRAPADGSHADPAYEARLAALPRNNDNNSLRDSVTHDFFRYPVCLSSRDIDGNETSVIPVDTTRELQSMIRELSSLEGLTFRGSTGAWVRQSSVCTVRLDDQMIEEIQREITLQESPWMQYYTSVR